MDLTGFISRGVKMHCRVDTPCSECNKSKELRTRSTQSIRCHESPGSRGNHITKTPPHSTFTTPNGLVQLTLKSTHRKIPKQLPTRNPCQQRSCLHRRQHQTWRCCRLRLHQNLSSKTKTLTERMIVGSLTHLNQVHLVETLNVNSMYTVHLSCYWRAL